MGIEGHVRAGALSGFRELVFELGGNPAEILGALNITESQLSDPDNIISGVQHRMALIRAAEHTHTPRFGLLLSQRQTLQKFGAIGYLSQTAPTVGESLGLLVKYIRTHDTVTLPEISEQDGIALLSLRTPSLSGESMVQQAETGVGIALKIFRSLIGEHWVPGRVFFEHKQPSDTTLYHRIFRCPILFEQAVTAIEFASEVLTYPTSTSDPQLFAILSEHVKQKFESDNDYLEDQIRSEIVKGLECGEVNLDDVSRALGMSRNKLQRLLKSMGLSFQDLLDRTRCQIAQSYLKDTSLPITEITSLLAYAEPAVFTRAFKRQTGITPTQWRSRNLQLSQPV